MATFLENPVQSISVDGKGVSINDLPAEAWRVIQGGYTDEETARLFRAVPWLFRGVHLRAQAVATVPFTIENKSGEVVDTSRDYKNVVKFLPNIRRLLYLYEGSLTIEGRAYLVKNLGAKTKQVKELQYLHPLSVRPHITDGRVDYFERMTSADTQARALGEKEMVYSFYPDFYVEAGAGGSPGRAALAASGVLSSSDDFVKAFWLRGAIKATLLTVENEEYTDEQEMGRLRAWWRRVFSGAKEMWNAHVVNAKVKPVIIGEGLESLTNSTLTREKREDIGVALGIPLSLLFSDAANFATAKQDDLHFYDKTVRGEIELIESDWNEHLFLPAGYRIRFNVEGLDIFQEDENERSQAYKNYVDAGMRPSIAAQVVGLDLPEGMTFEKLDEEWDAKQEARVAASQALADGVTQLPNKQDAQDKPDSQAMADEEKAVTPLREELSRWQRKSLRAIKDGKPFPVEFASEVIPETLRAVIDGALESASSPEQVKAVFDHALHWREYP